MKIRKNKAVIPVIISILTIGSLLGCSSVNSSESSIENNTSSDSSTLEENSSEITTSETEKIEIKTMLFALNQKDFLYGEEINLSTDFSVSMILTNNVEKVANYDENHANGWYFEKIINPKGETITKLPSTFLDKGTYKFYLGCAYKNEALNFNKLEDRPNGEIIVHGGSFSNTKPEKLIITLNKKDFNIGDTFTSDNFVVQGDWKLYGGKDDISSDKYSFSSTQFELGKPLKNAGTYSFTITYLGMSETASFRVIEKQAISKSEVTYTYNNLSTDNAYGLNFMKSIGEPKTLIVPVWFKNSNNFVQNKDKETVREMIRLAYLGTPEQTGWHSVQSYYWEDSYHQLKINGEVAPWYDCDMYAQDVGLDNTTALASTVANNYRQYLIDNNRLDEWTSFDTNKDGYLDAVIMIYAAEPNYLGNDNLWAYCFWDVDNTPNVNNPVANAFFWASYQFMLSDQPAASPIIIDAHTYIHEMGHILGLEDYYDCAYRNNPAGGFSMQDNNVGGHDPFSKLAYGWIKPYVPNESVTLTIGDFDSTGEAIVLCPDWDGSAFNEYLILEYWTPTGLNELDSTYLYSNNGPKGPSETGLRLWHVDSLLHATDGDTIYGERVTRKPEGVEGVISTMSNTTYTNGVDKDADGYTSPFQEERRFDQLALLNKSKTNLKRPYKFNEEFSKNHLFDVHDKFDMKTYEQQFPNKGKLDSGMPLGFEFEVVGKTAKEISVKITKI